MSETYQQVVPWVIERIRTLCRQLFLLLLVFLLVLSTLLFVKVASDFFCKWNSLVSIRKRHASLIFLIINREFCCLHTRLLNSIVHPAL